MAPISASEAATTLQPLLPTIRQVFDRAWDHYLSKYDIALRLDHSKRSRASILHDLLTIYARQLLEGRAGVVFRRIRGLFLIEINAQFLVKLKKLDRVGRPRNVATEQSDLFNSQEFQQLELPGIPVATSLVAGYQLDPMEQGIEACLMVCPNGNRKWWSFFMDTPSAEQPGPLAPPPFLTPLTPMKPRKVRAKNFAVKKRARRTDAS